MFSQSEMHAPLSGSQSTLTLDSIVSFFCFFFFFEGPELYTIYPPACHYYCSTFISTSFLSFSPSMYTLCFGSISLPQISVTRLEVKGYNSSIFVALHVFATLNSKKTSPCWRSLLFSIIQSGPTIPGPAESYLWLDITCVTRRVWSKERGEQSLTFVLQALDFVCGHHTVRHLSTFSRR